MFDWVLNMPLDMYKHAFQYTISYLSMLRYTRNYKLQDLIHFFLHTFVSFVKSFASAGEKVAI